MKVILLQRVSKLGYIGDVVNVKPGYARNYLLPKKIALRATKENLKYFEDQKEQIQKNNEIAKAEAQKVADQMGQLAISLVRQASEKGQLYGSVTGRDISAAIKELGYKVSAGQVDLSAPIKTIGVYEIDVNLHPEVSVMVKLSVAKSEEEAKQQISAEAEDQAKAENA
ncbi:MAG: 50S ribosomal protein L9 [Alphaproteobacteria bacterium]|nr:50S ribosomal protein L9 [Alphaproteobacteria bacterium]